MLVKKKTRISMGKMVVVYEPRQEYLSITEAIIKGGKYTLYSTRSLNDLKQYQRQFDIDLVLVDADLQIGDVSVFDVVYELQNMGLKGKVGLLIPSTFKRSKLMSLLASDPVCLISRSSLPAEVRRLVESATTQQRVIKPRYIEWIKRYSGQFVNGTIETDTEKITAGGGNVELYLLASREAMDQGDVYRSMSHLVSAFKLMPYSFSLYRHVLDNCHKDDSVYRVALRYLKAHPASSPYFNGGATLAFIRLTRHRKYAENLQKLMTKRVDGLSELKRI